MTFRNASKLVRSLGEACRVHVLDEKWVIATSRRVGFQWLDALAAAGETVLNARVKTIEGVALELALPEMARRGMRYISAPLAEVVADAAFGRMREGGGRYLSTIEPGPGLSRAVLRAVRDLRLAGLGAGDLEATRFEVRSKGADVRALLEAYSDELGNRGLLDYADVLGIASARLESDLEALPRNALFLLPRDLAGGLRGLEKLLIDAVGEEALLLLDVDEPGHPAGESGDAGFTDAELLRFIGDPTGAPAPARDGTADITMAVGEANEVREVLRRCAEGGISLDTVELLHTDTETYVPLVYEVTSALLPSIEGDEGPPVTFAQGIPVRYSRPARALAGWLSWADEGYPQSTLVRMIQDGLLKVGARGAGMQAPGFGRLAAVLRSVPIGGGRERYLVALDREIRLAGTPVPAALAEEESVEESSERARKRLTALEALEDTVRALLELESARSAGQKACLEAAAAFLRGHARAANEFDEYALGRLLDEVEALAECLEADLAGLDPWTWLEGLARSLHVGGQGPRPGRLYVAPLLEGGHSGRPHTFIVGLDDGRFPGSGGQDPILLDTERRRLSPELPTATGRLVRDLEEFDRLLSRVRGSVHLTFSSRNVIEERDMSPSPVVMAAYRVLSGEREGDQAGLLSWLPPPASFAPLSPGRSLAGSDWWLWRLTGDEPVEAPEDLVAKAFPNLGRGLAARRARASDRFTEYDGLVPEAGGDFDPRTTGRVLSASALELLGRCPMEYFFRYVLGIEPLEEHVVDRARWLDPLQRGELLHDVFREFMTAVGRRGYPPSRERDAALMRKILASQIEKWRALVSAPSRDVFEREARDLVACADIFLLEEQEHCVDSPEFFEVAIGLEPGGEGSAVDTAEPQRVQLPDGSSILARGRLDRVDRAGTAGRPPPAYTVIDYKTGSTWGYEQADPFRGGRRIQGYLYLALFQSRLVEVMPGARVTAFRYFFPSSRAQGERLEWSAERLAEGGLVVAALCDTVSAGAFPFTDEPGDVRFSDYRAAYGNVDAAAAGALRKLSNPRNEAIGPFATLRGLLP